MRNALRIRQTLTAANAQKDTMGNFANLVYLYIQIKTNEYNLIKIVFIKSETNECQIVDAYGNIKSPCLNNGLKLKTNYYKIMIQIIYLKY